jgi:DNA-directed RNA polymerase specialized sigma24 family protein
MGSFREAVATLYRELGPSLLAYARSLLGDPMEAEDAVQHVFLKIMSARMTALPREPRPYLFRAVRNRCFNRRRDAVREWQRTADAPMFVAPAGLGPVAADVETALGELPDEQREVVVLRIWAGMTLDEVAQTVGIPVNTAASRYRYALAKLRDSLGVHLRSRA